MNLIQKYKPNKLSEFIDNKKALTDLISAVKNGDKVIIHGPTGIGKSLALELIARELNYNVLELNSSDMRSKKHLESKIIPFLSQRALFSKGRILVIDELEGLGGKDRGAVTFIKNIVGKTHYPIILITTNLWSSKLISLRFALKNIEFKKPSRSEVRNFLSMVSTKENLGISQEKINLIIENNKSDIRACLNDLEAGLFEERKKDESIFDALKVVFRDEDEENVKNAFDNVNNMQFGDYLHWLGENIPREYYSPKEREDAYDALSKSNIFYSRILKRNYWKLLYHAYILATVGVMVSKRTKREEYINYSYPTFLTKMSKTRFSRAKIRAVRKAFGKETHCSEKKAADYVWFIEEMFKYNPKKAYNKMVKK